MESIERLIGRSGLLNLLRVSLVPARPSEDSIYNVVTKWPFQLYLTTNFDDEIIKHLKKNKRTEFAVLGNSESDFSVLLPDATGYVFKIHGELTENGGAVVTDKDYDGFKVGADKRYYRKALQALFRSRRIIVIGYSFSDSDLRYLLDRATEDASLAYPLCVFLPDATQQQIEKFSRSMSVAVVPYSNSDKKHTALKRILSLLNSFIRPDSPTTIHTEDSRRAASLYLFRKLSRGRSCRNINNLILYLLPEFDQSGIPLDKIVERIHTSKDECRRGILELQERGLAVFDKSGYRRSRKGSTLISNQIKAFDVNKRTAIDAFVNEIGIALSGAEEKQFRELVDVAICEIFNKRGLAVVKSLMGNGDTTSGELFEIYSVVANVAAAIQKDELRLLFIQGVRRFVFSPSLHQKEYLVTLSQGYFLFHLQGNADVMKSIGATFISKADWYVDSHILQALVAEGCASNAFMKSLFDILVRKGAKLYVTPGVIEEVLYHFDEADKRSPEKCGDFYSTALSLLKDKYNFFLDGFINCMARGDVASYQQYSKRINRVITNRLRAVLMKYGIKEVRIDLESAEYKRRFEETIKVVDKIRRKKNREEPNQLKVKTDAEIYVAVTQKEDEYVRCGISRKVYFLSHSTMFDRVERTLKRWTDYALYRVIQSLPNENAPTMTMYDCLHRELIGTGFRLVDESNYNRFFSDAINVAKMDFQNEFEEYVEEVESGSALEKEEFEAYFNTIPDIEKPIFVAAMKERLAKRDKERVLDEIQKRQTAEKRASGLEQQIAALKEELSKAKAMSEKERRRKDVEERTLRNAGDAKHVAKRLRQAKKRLRKGKKRR